MGERIHNEKASSSGSEGWLWPGAISQPPFTIPEADYNTKGVTWYSTAPDGQISRSFYTSSANYAKYGPSQNVSVRDELDGVGRTEEQQRPWSGNEITTQTKNQKLNRVKRIGVPILPD